jgi:hypothetical protein
MSTTAMAAVFGHSASKGSARLILLAMADEANDEGLLTAYRRSQSWLAIKANVDGGTARRAIAALVELGEVEVLAVGDGRESSNYRLHLPGLDGARIEGRQVAPPPPARRAPRGGETRAQGVHPAPPIIPFSPTPPGPPKDTRADDLASFEAFWQAYPRKTAKGDARKAWPTAVKAAGGTGPIIAGAARYAADPNRDPSYTAHASTWLRAERWDDPPLPPRRGPVTRGPNPANVSNVDTNRGGVSGELDLSVDP